MSQPTENKKWSCDYCTYENWLASKKCSICRTSRTPQYISDEVPAEKDIYKLAPLIHQDSQPSSPTPVLKNLDPANKWACQACTYLNWPKSLKCTQCLTTRIKAVPVLSKNENQPLSIDVNVQQASGPKSKNNSPNISPKSPDVAKEINNDLNKAIAASTNIITCAVSKPIKWTCKACTYENWPRSSKCVLCGVLKGRSYAEGSSVSCAQECSNAVNDFEIKKKYVPNTSKIKKRSPPSSRPSSARSTDSTDIYQLGGATASPPSNISSEKQDKVEDASISSNSSCVGSSSTSSNSKTNVRHMRKIRDSDWLWVNACKGVVDGDLHAVEAFLAANGDPSRQLSAEECAMLNRPSAFQVGYTLVHLAIRFQREDLLTALLTATDVVKKAKKRVPSHVAPDLAREILRELSIGIRRRKGDFPCYFLTDLSTFALPAGSILLFIILFCRSLNKKLCRTNLVIFERPPRKSMLKACR